MIFIYKTNQRTNLQNKKTKKHIIVFLLNNFIWTNIYIETIFYFLPNGRNKIIRQENKNILNEIIVSLFSCFVNPFPGSSIN